MSVRQEAVILVHGLWVRGIALSVLRHRLVRGPDHAERSAPTAPTEPIARTVRTFSYPSMVGGLDANSRTLSDLIAAMPAPKIHLVGHSLGGLVILNLLAQAANPRIGRVVLMGSPCAGCHCAAELLRVPMLSSIVGASLRDALTRMPWQAPEQLEIGVLSGSRSLGLGRLIPGLPRPNDGVVAVAETRLESCRDRMTLPVSHSEMIFSRACAAQVVCFLDHGHFDHG